MSVGCMAVVVEVQGEETCARGRQFPTGVEFHIRQTLSAER